MVGTWEFGSAFGGCELYRQLLVLGLVKCVGGQTAWRKVDRYGAWGKTDGRDSWVTVGGQETLMEVGGWETSVEVGGWEILVEIEVLDEI